MPRNAFVLRAKRHPFPLSPCDTYDLAGVKRLRCSLYLNVRCSFPREPFARIAMKNCETERLTSCLGGEGGEAGRHETRSLLDRGISRLLSQISSQHGRKQLRWISSAALAALSCPWLKD